MRFKKSFSENNHSLQNQFTAYLITALQHKRYNVLALRIKQQQYELTTDIDDLTILEDMNAQSINIEPTSMEQMEFQNESLERAIGSLTQQERFVLFNRALAEHSFEEIASNLNLSYKGVAAIYYRAMQKIKKQMDGDQNGL